MEPPIFEKAKNTQIMHRAESRAHPTLHTCTGNITPVQQDSTNHRQVGATVSNKRCATICLWERKLDSGIMFPCCNGTASNTTDEDNHSSCEANESGFQGDSQQRHLLHGRMSLALLFAATALSLPALAMAFGSNATAALVGGNATDATGAMTSFVLGNSTNSTTKPTLGNATSTNIIGNATNITSLTFTGNAAGTNTTTASMQALDSFNSSGVITLQGGYQLESLDRDFHASSRRSRAAAPFDDLEANGQDQNLIVSNTAYDYRNYQQARIIGGRHVDPANDIFPYFVAVFKQPDSTSNVVEYVCGGVLITPTLVLCAYHCADKADVVQLGRPNLLDSSASVETFRIKQKVAHPKANQETAFNFDVVIFELSGASNHTPIPSLDFRRRRFWKGEKLSVTGHGKTSTSSTTISPNRMMTKVRVLDSENCERRYGEEKFRDNMMCAAESGQDACQGDSGGPLVDLGDDEDDPSDDNLVGLVSWGYGCANEMYPGIYASIGYMYKWLREQVCSLSGEMCDCEDSSIVRYKGSSKSCRFIGRRRRRCEQFGEYCPSSCKLC